MPACKGCGKEFRQNRPFQVFCTSECKGVYFRHKYKLQAVKDAEDRLNGRRKVNGNGGHKQKQGLEEVLAEMKAKFEAEATAKAEPEPRFARRF